MAALRMLMVIIGVFRVARNVILVFVPRLFLALLMPWLLSGGVLIEDS